MKNITLSADGDLIEQAREVARARKTTLNRLFREWLADLAGSSERERAITKLLERLAYAEAGRKFTRQEMNER